ncbi:MAG TPA: phosphoglycerate mutase family protein [Acidimicrobiia bacterium]
MTIYLLRHCKAGRRSSDLDEDWWRPLSVAGRRQARELTHAMHKARFAFILSSPYVRCMESVVPLAAHHALAIKPTEALAEGASLEGALALVKQHAERGAVLSSHGDIIPAVLEYLAANGTDLGRQPRCEKGSIWAIDGEIDSGAAARYIPPT